MDKIAQTAPLSTEEVMRQLRLMPQQIARVPIQMPADVQPGQQKEYMNMVQEPIGETEEVAGTVNELLGELAEGVDDLPIQAGTYFDLFKEAQAPAVPTQAPDAMQGKGVDPTSDPTGDQSSSIPQFFEGFQSVRQFLDSAQDPVEISQQFRQLWGDDTSMNDKETSQSIDPQHNLSDMVTDYMQRRETAGDDEKDQMAMEIYEMLPQNVKKEQNPGINDGQIETIQKGVAEKNFASIVQETNSAIQKLAETLAKSRRPKDGKFNLKRFAQHKSLEQSVMFGPNQTSIDPFTGQLISSWHLVERNKGYGFKLDDILDIDWETIWRSTIMDKYSRPYRNDKGEWVGGYIEKRFEVNHNIPEGNNYQLKPGQLRKPYLPEFGSTEARLEAMREKDAKTRGYEPASEGKPFNWKEANKKKVVK